MAGLPRGMIAWLRRTMHRQCEVPDGTKRIGGAEHYEKSLSGESFGELQIRSIVSQFEKTRPHKMSGKWRAQAALDVSASLDGGGQKRGGFVAAPAPARACYDKWCVRAS